MIAKDKIMEAWIMVEHLSEGDINVNAKSILNMDSLREHNFYSLFLQEIEKKKFHPKLKSGIVVYLDIFGFEEVVSILREQYNLKPTDEELRIGNKFSFALYFDRDLNFQQDMTFFTVSAYIRYYKKVPHEQEFRDFEEDLKQKFSEYFDETSKSPEKFNTALQKVMSQFGINVKNCRIQILKNIETEATNLHSFFIHDLEKAKTIESANLHSYLHGNKKQRINLDSKKESPNFHPYEFEKILQPENYPLGRFPSNTKYALSFMQQVAVNLSIGLDNNQMRSVNGPPGTGKTTLLKDIFAQLVVQQAYNIASLQDKIIKGTEDTIYYEHASIGVVPAHITEDNIIVASSNNGAVQNIVNELPFSEGIDATLLGELRQVDYFRETANTKITTEWTEDESGKRREELVIETSRDEEKFWGLFSLEGGKADNMTNILTKIKHVHKYLEEEYLPDEDIYKQFLKQYKEVMKIQTKAQAFADSIKAHQNCVQETERLEQLHIHLEKAESEAKNLQNRRNSLELRLQLHKEQKPGLFARRMAKQEYKSRSREISDEFMRLEDEDSKNSARKNQINSQIVECQMKLNQIEKKIHKYEVIIDGSVIEPLHMDLEYDDLQMSNPWFDELYRIAQSRLFVAALRVRKQFLYENKKNIKAAVIVWSQQEKYLERKLVIEAAWNWINMTVPVISSTFASFPRMCKNLGPESLGHLFIDEAGQALPQAAVGAVYRSRHVMVVGDPSQIKPVLTLDSNTLSMLGRHFGVTEKYLSATASVQTLVDAASQYGFYRTQDMSEGSWIGIPLWVHRRCQYPMFTISNVISYDGFMVQGMKESGKAGWFDIGGKADNKYVEEQGEFLLQKIKEMVKQNPKIVDKKEKDVVYVITPFSNVAYQLSQKLRKINFTRYDTVGKPINVGTVHTFQGKEAPIVFFVLGADHQSRGAARWAVSEPNMMNVAATRAKKEFYIIGDKKLYLGLGSDVATNTERIIRQYNMQNPGFVDDEVNPVRKKKASILPKDDVKRITGNVKYVGKGKESFYAYVTGDDGKEYTINESIYSRTSHAKEIIQKGNKISFVPEEGKSKPCATDIMPID